MKRSRWTEKRILVLGESRITPMFLAWVTASTGGTCTLVRSLEEGWICTGKFNNTLNNL